MADPNPAILGGTLLPNVQALSPLVGVALGQNPSMFTGPGTNTYLVGRGRKRLLVDTGSGLDVYMPVLEEALARVGCEGLEGIVLTHAHPDHIGGVDQIRAHFGELPVYKKPWPSETGLAGPGGGVSPISVAEPDRQAHCRLERIDHGDVVETEGARLRAVYTPGHAPDHLCFVLEEERNLFSGDNVLGVGTTVIPGGSGDLGDYLASLEKLRTEAPGQIYPAHGPRIDRGVAKIEEYIAHRLERERQIVAALAAGLREVPAMVRRIYVGYPESLFAAAGQSVTAHLLKLEREGRVRREEAADGSPLWTLVA
ncbi:beta-lactamase-like protein 2 [Myxococcota bacterium]|nr:beta-lactamase-like protein 2 [Myxococcota bacterium]